MGIIKKQTDFTMAKGQDKKGNKAQKGTQGKKQMTKYIINCRMPIEDNVIVLSDFESFLSQRIKVEGKTGNLGSAVTVAKDKDTLVVSASIDFSKRYLKYLTKKYLKKQQMREYLRVVATSKNTYELRYLQVDNDEEDKKE